MTKLHPLATLQPGEHPGTLTLPGPTFERLERVAIALGVHPDDVLTKRPAHVVDVVARAERAELGQHSRAVTRSITRALAPITSEDGEPVEVADLFAAAVVALRFFEACRECAQNAGQRVGHYADRLGYIADGANEAVDLARCMATAAPADADALRSMPLEACLYDLGLRGVEAAFQEEKQRD